MADGRAAVIAEGGTLTPAKKKVVQEAKGGNPYHAKDGKFTTGGSGGTGSTGGDPILPENPSIAEVNTVADRFDGKSNLEIFDELKYNGLPGITDKKISNPMVRYETGAEPEKYKQDLMYNKKRYLPDIAVMGSGTYFSPKADTLYAFGGGLRVNAAFKKKTKVGSIGDTHLLRQKLLSSKGISVKAARLVSDYGVLAALQGYDAITNPTTIVVMNRSKLVIEKT